MDKRCEGCPAHSETDCVIPSPEIGCPRDNLEGPLRDWILERAARQIASWNKGCELASLSMAVADDCVANANCEPESVVRLRKFVSENYKVVE